MNATIMPARSRRECPLLAAVFFLHILKRWISFDSIVMGYHMYKDIWGSQQGKTLPCCRETSDGHDPFAVGVVKNGIIVGQVLRRFRCVFLV